MIVREPLGVVARGRAVELPAADGAWKLGPALATGNSVVLKPAEQSPLTALRLAELAAEAGVPDGVLKVVPGFGETAGQALGRHTDVDMVAFTGSTEVGKFFLRYSGESNMKRVALECGGKSPQHRVGRRARPRRRRAAAAAWGVFYNQGEVCNAGSRLLVHEHDQGRVRSSRSSTIAREIAPGDPLDPEDPDGRDGRRDARLERVLGYIETGQKRGRRAAARRQPRARRRRGGFYVEPTIFDARRATR